MLKRIWPPPAIDRSFHASADELQWVINAYLLPLSALLLLGGAAGDRMGRRLLLIIGIAVFTVSSIGCAVAPSLPLLLLSRGLQGVEFDLQHAGQRLPVGGARMARPVLPDHLAEQAAELLNEG